MKTECVNIYENVRKKFKHTRYCCSNFIISKIFCTRNVLSDITHTRIIKRNRIRKKLKYTEYQTRCPTT